MRFTNNLTLRAIGELLFTPRCTACDVPLPVGAIDPLDRVFCTPCSHSVDKPLGAKCPRCAAIFETGDVDHLCSECIKSPPHFHGSLSAFAYGGSIATGITRLKYSPAPWLALPLGTLLAKQLADVYTGGLDVDLVVPVPLHTKRLRQRGFNQSVLLARVVAKSLSLPLNTSALVRVTETPFQAGSDRATRLAQMKNCFATPAPKLVAEKSILLVDDVVTTTATVRDASRSLALAGASKITVAAVARSI